jgi:hypothetical protein
VVDEVSRVERLTLKVDRTNYGYKLKGNGVYRPHDAGKELSAVQPLTTFEEPATFRSQIEIPIT